MRFSALNFYLKIVFFIALIFILLMDIWNSTWIPLDNTDNGAIQDMMKIKPLNEQSAPKDFNLRRNVLSPHENKAQSSWNMFSSDVHDDDPRLIEHILKHRLIPPSQNPYNLEHKTTDPSASAELHEFVRRMLRNQKVGFFIECGANDGEFLSNTLVLERDFGWTGLLVEVDEFPLNKLYMKNRKAWIAGVCLSSKSYPEKISMVRHKDWNGFSRQSSNDFVDDMKSDDFPYEFKADCFPLYSILKAINVTSVDYFSMDMEGAEMGVLESFPFERIHIKILSIEAMPKTRSKIINLMTEKGYHIAKIVENTYIRDIVFVSNQCC